MTEPMEERGILEIEPQEILRLLEISPDYRFAGCAYDFDGQVFKFKFAHPLFPAKEEGNLLPLLTRGPEGRLVPKLRNTYAQGYHDGRYDREAAKAK